MQRDGGRRLLYCDRNARSDAEQVIGDDEIVLVQAGRRGRRFAAIHLGHPVDRRPGVDLAQLCLAVHDDQVQVICAYSSDGRIVANKLRVLEDPKRVLPPYDAILLLSRKGAQNAKLREVLTPLVEKVEPTLMQRANLRVDVDEVSPRIAAREMLAVLNKSPANQ